MKKSFIKKITTTILVGGVIIGAFATNGFAKNNADTWWQFYKELGNKGNHYINDLRYKEDSSPAYVYIKVTDNMHSDDFVNMKVVDSSHNSLIGSLPAKTSYGKG